MQVDLIVGTPLHILDQQSEAEQQWRLERIDDRTEWEKRFHSVILVNTIQVLSFIINYMTTCLQYSHGFSNIYDGIAFFVC